MPDDPTTVAVPRRDRMGVSGSQVAASVLASTSAAVVASFFGVAGTIIGAAVVSVIATIGTAAYGLGIRRTKDRLQTLQATRQGRPVGRLTGSTGVTDADTSAPRPSPDSTPDTAESPAVGAPTGDRSRWRLLAHHRWSLAGAAVLVLVLSLGAVSLIEVATDGPLSGGSASGRTSIGAVFRSGDGQTDDGDQLDGGSGASTTTSTTTGGAPAPAPAGSDAPDRGQTTTTEGGRETSTTSTTAPTTTSTIRPTPSTTVAPEPSTDTPEGSPAP
jgi:hypothetical protein